MGANSRANLSKSKRADGKDRIQLRGRIIAFLNAAGTVKKLLDRIGEATQPARIAPAREPPPWETAAAAEPAGNDAQWDSSAHPATEIEFDQRIAWSAGDARAGDAIREAFLRTVMRAGPKAAIDGYTRRQPHTQKALWISNP